MRTKSRPTDDETHRDVSGLLLFVAIIAALFLPHILSYLSTRPKPKASSDSLPKRTVERVGGDSSLVLSTSAASTVQMNSPATEGSNNNSNRKNREVPTEITREQVNDTVSSSNWRCACEGGFLPPGMLQSLGGAEAVVRMSTGQCYHKQR
jgi:hypothetical protein